MVTEKLSSPTPRPPFPLARFGKPPNTGRMERFLKKLAISNAAYSHWSGHQPLNQFAKDNPTWTQRAWEVLILENLEILGATMPQTSTRRPPLDSPQHKKSPSVGKGVGEDG